jgi:hypothetical protein
MDVVSRDKAEAEYIALLRAAGQIYGLIEAVLWLRAHQHLTRTRAEAAAGEFESLVQNALTLGAHVVPRPGAEIEMDVLVLQQRDILPKSASLPFRESYLETLMRQG